MGKPASNKSASPKPSGGNRLFTGLLIGMMIGVGMAALLAWYITKSPNTIVQKTPTNATVLPAQQPPSTPPTATDRRDDTNKGLGLEFYTTLTGKQANALPPPPAEKNKTAEPKSASTNPAQALQAGSFSSVDDAEKLKAKLAMLGMESTIQAAAIPDKGVKYRVRLGPYQNAGDLARAQNILKQNGMTSVLMPAQ
jgi:cell division protein FtsN